MHGGRIALAALVAAALVAAAAPATASFPAAEQGPKPGNACRENKPGKKPKKCSGEEPVKGDHGGPSIPSGPVGEPQAVVALIDTGINPYSEAFRDTSPLARKHPSTYIPGYPEDAIELKLSLGVPYKDAVEEDADVWAAVEPGKLYWVPGTRIVGAISLGDGGVSCPSVSVPPVNGFTNGDC